MTSNYKSSSIILSVLDYSSKMTSILFFSFLDVCLLLFVRDKVKIFDYLGNLMTVSIAGSLLLFPSLIIGEGYSNALFALLYPERHKLEVLEDEKDFEVRLRIFLNQESI